MSYEDLTDKQQKVVDADVKLRLEQGDVPTGEDVANLAYGSCGTGMVWYVRNKFGDIIEERLDKAREVKETPEQEDDTSESENVTINDLIRMIRGETLVDGDYTLSFNDDGEERWYLRYDDGNIHHAVGFTSVEYDGKGLGFYSDDSYSLTVDHLDNSAPRIYEVLMALSQES